ncbi:DNA polymerase [Kitasatospora sp. YST-16]|uniref:DNA polymerase n=1 Tax=Kitasatospora sp. YST-16 TaxID=2998080 RepID=UPI002284CDB7|nr:DNA polymerase [Kitasatospora sp. YST-16]WAL73130.1 DNA polymerase [Kitasatospora sp. YST-16]WNW39184.1 DNA polymerase [Streptomyces sp. Li-HN-5-13]
MQTYTHEVAGETVRVHVPATVDDLDQFRKWWRRATNRGPVAVDTETTGLALFAPDFRLRTVQFGDRTDAWVIHWERGGSFRQYARDALIRTRDMLIHNAAYDLLVIDRHAGIPLEDLVDRVTDTRILATLIDPRQPMEGGIGTALKPLSAFWVDPSAPDTQGDLTGVFRSLGLTKATGFARIDLDHPTFNLYGGLDCILTARLEPILRAELRRLDVREALVDYEHDLARMCMIMERTGLVLDVPYTRRLAAQLSAEAAEFAEKATRYGVTSVNATKQIAEALVGMGETLTERTASGALKVDKSVLLRLADMDLQWKRLGVRTPNPLAEAVLRSKRAGKWGTTYAQTFLDSVDDAGRVHAAINTLAARTGRMSVQRPAVQTLPSGDQMIRRCLLADEGEVMVSTDFAAIEMRVLAGLAGIKRMAEGFRAGEDIHWFTARLIKGEDATEKDRKVFKGAGFSKVYGGGPATAARQTGATEEAMRRAFAEYDRLYPEIRRASNRWQREAAAHRMIFISATGRRLPLDRDRAYAVVNYACQSAARDCLGQAMLNMDDAGLLPYLRLPIHDEVLASVPAKEAEEVAREITRCMTFDFYGVPIIAEAEIGKRSWGSLYGADF